MFTTHRKWREGSIGGREYSCCNTSLLSRYENYWIIDCNCIYYTWIRRAQYTPWPSYWPRPIVLSKCLIPTSVFFFFFIKLYSLQWMIFRIYKGRRQNSPLTTAENGSFLQPSVTLILYQLPLEIMITANNGEYRHTMIINFKKMVS